MTQYPIQPTPFVVPNINTTLDAIFMVINYQVGMTQMYVPYNLLETGTGASMFNGTALITEAELAQWGEDDMYIVNLVAAQAGVTIV